MSAFREMASLQPARQLIFCVRPQEQPFCEQLACGSKRESDWSVSKELLSSWLNVGPYHVSANTLESSPIRRDIQKRSGSGCFERLSTLTARSISRASSTMGMTTKSWNACRESRKQYAQARSAI